MGTSPRCDTIENLGVGDTCEPRLPVSGVASAAVVGGGLHVEVEPSFSGLVVTLPITVTHRDATTETVAAAITVEPADPYDVSWCPSLPSSLLQR
jgi:hypothetical protein